MPGYPCCCLGLGVDPCDTCIEGTTPTKMRVHINDIPDGECAAAGGVNDMEGIYVLDRDGDDTCLFTMTAKTLTVDDYLESAGSSTCVCDNSYNWQLDITVRILTGGSGWTVTIGYTSDNIFSSGDHIAYFIRSTPTTLPYSCDALAKATATFNSQQFGGIIACSPGDSYELINADIEVEPWS